MTQGKRIRAIRKIRGYTRKELGMKVGMNPKSAASRISRYEEDKCSPRKDTLMKIAEALNVSPMAISPYTGRDFREILEILFWLEEAQNTDGIGELSEIFTMMDVWERVKDKRNKPIDSDPGSKLYYVTQMLNYVLVDNGEEFGIRHVFGITKDMLERFFYDYALEAMGNGRYRGQATIEMCIATVVGFMANLSWKYGGFMKVKHSDLYKEKIIYDKRGKQKKISIPAFQVNGVKEVKYIFRDIPTKAFEIMIPLAFRFAPGIAFAMCIQAFAGLRPGEACNVRREDSPYGPGITITEIGGRASKIEIDLKRELRLRSDDVKVGDIKKERTQFVYPVFIDAFMKAYELHKRYMVGRKYEQDYGPMFVNSRGMAMNQK